MLLKEKRAELRKVNKLRNAKKQAKKDKDNYKKCVEGQLTNKGLRESIGEYKPEIEADSQ